MKEIENNDALLDELISSQIPEVEDNTKNNAIQPKQTAEIIEEPETDANVEIPQNEAKKYLGTQLEHFGTKADANEREKNKQLVEEKGLTKVGENIFQKAEFREGWIDVDRRLLGDRDIFYPESWQFRIRPATVEAIRNWSNIDDENPLSIDSVFNEILKSCLSIVTPTGNIPWGNICTWDRFFFLLLIRQYTFNQGERNISYDQECPECENMVNFTLTAQTLMYDTPDEEVLRHYDRETRTWTIDPEEYDLFDEKPFTLYVPTLDKDACIREWFVDKVRENPNKKKWDQAFLRFLPWMAQKVSKDLTIAKRQIREIQSIFNALDAEMFSFMDEVIRNIAVVPSETIITKCPVCGEEVTSPVRFPNGPRDLFNVQSKHKRFGKK